MPTTVLQELAAIRDQNAAILSYLAALSRATGSNCCLPANTIVPDLPPIPLLPPTVPPVQQQTADDLLCLRLQRELDNILSVWSQAIDILAAGGTIAVSALAALVGAALAPETAGLSAVGLAALSGGLIAVLGERATEYRTLTDAQRLQIVRAAYAERAGGSQAATDAAIAELRTIWGPEVGAVAGGLVNLFGGFGRAFGTSDIGSLAGYQLVCSGLQTRWPCVASAYSGPSSGTVYAVSWGGLGRTTDDVGYTYEFPIIGLPSLAGRTISYGGNLPSLLQVFGYAGAVGGPTTSLHPGTIMPQQFTIPAGYQGYFVQCIDQDALLGVYLYEV